MKNLQKSFIQSIEENILLKKKLVSYSNEVNQIIEIIHKTLKEKNKILICGNGGSAADAQHLSAEFLVRLRPKVNRKPLPIISLALDSSTITACGNDYSFDDLFARNFEALAKKGDLLFCISTSGNSKNILKVLKKAKDMKINSVSFLGNKGGKAKKLSNFNLIIPHSNTARIQEAHIFLGHFILESVEKIIFKK
tara:strand:- start:1280 stop:1864 length:585 start_codon:yes stop_codon:yes gene_type:complete